MCFYVGLGIILGFIAALVVWGFGEAYHWGFFWSNALPLVTWLLVVVLITWFGIEFDDAY